MLIANSLEEWLFLLAGVVLLDAVGEEFLFRGLLQRALENQLDVTRAILAVSFIFSLFYANPQVVVQIVLMGVILGVATWKSDSILPAIVAHVVISTLGIWLANTETSGNPWLDWNGHIHPLVLLGSVGMLVYGLSLIHI